MTNLNKYKTDISTLFTLSVKSYSISLLHDFYCLITKSKNKFRWIIKNATKIRLGLICVMEIETHVILIHIFPDTAYLIKYLDVH